MEPSAANEASSQRQTAADPIVGPPWLSWDQVPKDAHAVAQAGPWFVELYSGTARLTQSVRDLGVPCLPPIDVEVCELVPSPFDVVDHDLWAFFMQIVALGAIFYAHFGAPCNTFSAARKEDGGPPPLRSPEAPWGLPNLSSDNLALVFLGNLFLLRTIEAATVIVSMGGNFSVENPLHSLLWLVPAFQHLAVVARLFMVDFEQCNFGAPSKKPTRLAVTHEIFSDLAGSCRGGHTHIVLKGQVWCDRRQKWVFRTKLAQEYPWILCRRMARHVAVLFQGKLIQFDQSFQLVSKDARKRPVGQKVQWKDHRQRLTALKAVASGYQLKRGALKPLLDMETEPGTAIEWALSIWQRKCPWIHFCRRRSTSGILSPDVDPHEGRVAASLGETCSGSVARDGSEIEGSAGCFPSSALARCSG